VIDKAAVEAGSDALPASHIIAPVHQGAIEAACGLLAKITLVAMMVVIGGEVLARNILHYSWEGTDEFGSYLVVAATFLSLATCQAYGGYHELQMVKMRLSPRARAALNVVLYLVCIGATLILLWQYSRLVLTSWTNGDASSTSLRIPLWIPQLSMPLGIAALCLALAKTMFAELRVAMAHDPSPPPADRAA
jgi:TRAP-type C4-dicarboxylate transport system permease small subunit